MHVYLDIDGTLIHDGLHDFGMPAPYLEEFLTALNASDYTVYWLTTHCMRGDTTQLYAYLRKHLPEHIVEMTLHYKPTAWSEFKTEAIDFDHDFYWLDDNASLQEKEILRTHGAEDKLIEIDLHENPMCLKECIEILGI